MITCNIVGPGDPSKKGFFNFGLGNQLFQIATTLSLAKDNDVTATFPTMLDGHLGEYHNNLLKKLDIEEGVRTDPNEPPKFTSYLQEPSFSYNELRFVDNCVYSGYFQSEKYFVHNRDYILDMFSFPQDNLDYVNSKYADLLEGDTVSLHVRRGDYVHLESFHVLQDISYYKEALENFSGYKVLIFSDDIPWCKENLNIENASFIEGESDVVDLLLMSLCKSNIIANSSFSWWGAWLNNNDNKKVIAPKKWFGSEANYDDSDIIPESWVRV